MIYAWIVSHISEGWSLFGFATAKDVVIVPAVISLNTMDP